MEHSPNYYVVGFTSILVLWGAILLLMRSAGL